MWVVISLSYLYIMVALTRTDLLAHIANIFSRRKFSDRQSFLFHVCDKTILRFPAGELISCSTCLSAWVGAAWMLANGIPCWFASGLAAAFAWHVVDVILKRAE